jgi:hypothetical protein
MAVAAVLIMTLGWLLTVAIGAHLATISELNNTINKLTDEIISLKDSK